MREPAAAAHELALPAAEPRDHNVHAPEPGAAAVLRGAAGLDALLARCTERLAADRALRGELVGAATTVVGAAAVVVVVVSTTRRTAVDHSDPPDVELMVDCSHRNVAVQRQRQVDRLRRARGRGRGWLQRGYAREVGRRGRGIRG